MNRQDTAFNPHPTVVAEAFRQWCIDHNVLPGDAVFALSLALAIENACRSYVEAISRFTSSLAHDMAGISLTNSTQTPEGLDQFIRSFLKENQVKPSALESSLRALVANIPAPDFVASVAMSDADSLHHATMPPPGDRSS